MIGFIRLFSRSGPKIKIELSKKDRFSGWLKCSGCGEMIHAGELLESLNCCPKCNHHYRLTVQQRLKLLADKGTFEELFTELTAKDSLKFSDTETYADRLKRTIDKTGRTEAICVGLCKVNKKEVALGVFDFSFMGGSMGSVVGERIARLIERAIIERVPVVIVSASGGARMQESIFSLMQMAKTSAALARLHQAKLPFISILTNPTTGGVTASFASLGDVILAEPGALIGFAGPRVIEQTIRQKLPEGAQTAEFLQAKGMVDLVVPRKELKEKLSFFLEFFMQKATKSSRKRQKEQAHERNSCYV